MRERKPCGLSQNRPFPRDMVGISLCTHTQAHIHRAKGWEEVGGDWLRPFHIMNVGSSYTNAQEKEETIPNARKQASLGSWVSSLQEKGKRTGLALRRRIVTV